MRRLCPRRLGSFVQANAQRLLLLLSLALLVLCAAINSVKLDADLSSWIQRTSRVDSELQAIEAAIGDGAGTNSLLILQALKQQPASKRHHHHNQHQNQQQQQPQAQPQANNDILSVESLMIHLETLAIATHVTIDLFDVSWSLKDLCFSPTLPDYEGMLVNQILDHLMPCAIKTPLDCFWEGSKLLGPEQEVRLSSIGPKLRWTNLNPLLMIETKRRAQPHASFPYDALISWMKRTGISSGYLDRPCLDPSDPNCPISAPNKLTGEAPNIGRELTNGCHGLASKQMHWKEEELVGGVVRNRSGYIVRASALQSTIQLMGERDVYDYWRKTTKVQDINNWSTDKAKLVLEMWQQRFKDELAQFTRTSVASSPYKIQALTPKSMLEPISSSSILDLTNFKLTLALFTLAACVMFPKFQSQANTALSALPESNIEVNKHRLEDRCDPSLTDQQQQQKTIPRPKLILVAILISMIVILTFVASLGLSSFMNLPFNMITTQILPPMALYYGFRQALMISCTYAKHFTRVVSTDLTTECLNELLPIILFESIILILPLVVSSVLPIQATRVFCFQAITYIVLSTVTSILLIPSLLITVLMRDSVFASGHDEDANDSTIYIKYKTKNPRSRHPNAPSTLSIKAKKSIRGGVATTKCDKEPTIEELIFSRLQEDLRYIRADTHQQQSNIDFSAHFKLTTSRAQTNQQNRSRDSTLETMTECTQLPSESKPPPNSSGGLGSDLPDLLQWSSNKVHDDDFLARKENLSSSALDVDDEPHKDTSTQIAQPRPVNRQIHLYSNFLATNKWAQAIVCLVSLVLLVVIMPQSASVKCGLQLRDIVLRGSQEYDSLMLREKYFPVYNTFIITQDEFDYATNQRLLYELHKRVEQVNGVVSQTHGSGDKQGESTTGSKFWLIYFRDWLLELQDSFDADRNRSAISREGWSPDASDAAKLAYKLLAQTGRLDSPIDRSQVETNRLVDKNGLINQKAFYHYLTAWVMNDAFTYSNSEANFRPEPKTWNENAEDLRIERARPLNYAQMPFLLKLPEEEDGLKTIIELRGISQAFTQLGLPNFPTGIPFVFWDQFINLDLLFGCTFALLTITYISIAYLVMANLNLSLILIVPSLVAIAELYSLLGFFSFQFNTIVAVILVSSIATSTIQTTQCIMVSECRDRL
jgi:hypothetical protein